MTVNAQTLAVALRERGYRAEAVRPTPEARVAVVNVWYNRHDRGPAVCLWEPFGTDGWQWGDGGDYTAPGDIDVGELADCVIATLRPR